MIEDITDISKLEINNLNDNDIKLILSQTNYSQKTAIEKLNLLKDPILVIKEYLNPNYENTSIKKIKIQSINQGIYSEIREKFYSQKFKTSNSY